MLLVVLAPGRRRTPLAYVVQETAGVCWRQGTPMGPPLSNTGNMAHAQPTVTVIIPTYNRVHYLGMAMPSVCAQTFDDFELIVVDDGSTDDTLLPTASATLPLSAAGKRRR